MTTEICELHSFFDPKLDSIATIGKIGKLNLFGRVLKEVILPRNLNQVEVGHASFLPPPTEVFMISLSKRFAWVGAIFLFASTCQAGQVRATLDSTTNNGTVQLKINDGAGGSPGTSYNRAGYVNWHQSPDVTTPLNSSIASTFKTFCIELTENVSIGNTYRWNLVELQDAPKPGSANTGNPNGMGDLKANAIRRLWAGAYSDNMSAVDAAAFQLAIWRLEYDLADGKSISAMTNFGTGNFRAQGVSGDPDGYAAITAAQQLITYTLNGTYTAMADLVALSIDDPNGRQDQVTQRVPEPTSMALAAIGCATMIGVRVSRRKKA